MSTTVDPEVISLVNQVKDGAAKEEEWSETDTQTMLATLKRVLREGSSNSMAISATPTHTQTQ
jgi:hypothetical protein